LFIKNEKPRKCCLQKTFFRFFVFCKKKLSLEMLQKKVILSLEMLQKNQILSLEMLQKKMILSLEI